MTIELLDTEEAQTEDPVEVQVKPSPVLCAFSTPWGSGAATGTLWGSPTTSPVPMLAKHRLQIVHPEKPRLQCDHCPRKPERGWQLHMPHQGLVGVSRGRRPCDSQATLPPQPRSWLLPPLPWARGSLETLWRVTLHSPRIKPRSLTSRWRNSLARALRCTLYVGSWSL